MKNIAIILLAAGSSSRFGEPKQLIKFNGKSLINNALSAALAVNKNIIVVLGANENSVKKEIENKTVKILFNKDWEEGMASSIRCGLSFLIKENASNDAVIFMVCDQPFVTSSLIKKFMVAYEETNKPIVASAYNNTTGTPVLFDKIFFNELLALQGKHGAKKIISQHMDSTTTITFPSGEIDIDTKEDYNNLQKN
jgi:molybdenum cofactor cytidylyltransferase